MEQVATGRKVRVIPASRKTEAAERRAKTGVKRVAAYCRVSTDTEEQLNSYEAQKTYYTNLINGNLRNWHEKADGVQPYDCRLQTGTD